MNPRQRRMVMIVALAMCVVLLWPPVDLKTGELAVVSLFSDYDGSINFLLLIAELLSLALIGVLAYRVAGKGN